MNARTLIASLAALSLASATFAGTEGHHHPPTPPNAAFDKMKTLEGTWTGTAKFTEGGETMPTESTVSYHVTSGGSAVQEIIDPGGKFEMTTMYHVDGDQLMLTHYCAGGNQPRLRMTKGKDPNVLSFQCAGGTNMKEEDLHMHALSLTFVDADHLKAEWSSTTGKKPSGNAIFELTRKK